MIGRLLFKVIVFTLIILFFLYYQSSTEESNRAENSAINVSNLLLQEKQIYKDLSIEAGQSIPYQYVVIHNLPYIEGALIKLTQKDEHIVLAKVVVKDAYKVNVKPERVVDIIYTGHADDDDAPVIDEHYVWLIQEHSPSLYFIQGGKQGIVQVQ